MPEDKKIRVSADLSQMRSLREEASSLYRDLIQFSNEQNNLTDKALDQLKEQLQLLNQRNDLEALYAELKRKSNSIIPRRENSIRTKENDSEQQDSIRPRREVENEEENITNRRRNETNLNEDVQNRNRKETNLEEDVRNINRTTENISETVHNVRREQDQREAEPPTSDRDRNWDISDEQRDQNIRYEDRRERSFDESQGRIVDDSIKEILQEISQRILVSANDLVNPRIREATKAVNNVEGRLASIIDILMSIDENLAISTHGGDSPDHDNRPSIAPVVPIPTPTPTTDNDSENRRRQRDEDRRRDREDYRGWGGNSVARVISGVGSMAVSDPISQAGQVISTLGGVGGELVGMIPGIGNVLGGAVTAAANTFAGIVTTTVQKAVEAQRNVVPYSQTMGVSSSEAMATAGREGGYAASALGMNISEYLARRTQLIRSAGGKEESVAPVEETQSLMASERLYGLQGVDQLQAVMRFASDESTKSSSAIIRSIEMTMKELRKPFSEIASTMDESLQTFTKAADDVLSKSGEIDASKIAATMRTVRLTTNMEGRQLERVQQAAMGIGISQDDVTQAFLHRSVQQLYGSNLTMSEVKEKEENIVNDPKLIRTLLNTIQQATGGINEQFIQALKNVFPNLSYSDIRGWVRSGYFEQDQEKVVQRIQEKSEKALSPENDKINRYSPTAAAQTVSPGEQMMKNWENKMIGWGIGNLKYVRDISEAMEEFVKKMNEFNARMNGDKFVVDEKNPNQLNLIDQGMKDYIDRMQRMHDPSINFSRDNEIGNQILGWFKWLVDKIDE